ncbi:RnfH family protein [Granulosicoccaceae sp. 1_MG-2023]|nr:RnfH family protein [Granulosicoccaceae sp. 1_MG-2023]
MRIEVAFALPSRQKIYTLEVEEGITAREAVALAPLAQDFPDEDFSERKLGIFGKAVPDKQVLREGDRVEIYRELIADPKAVRKKRAAEGKRMKKGGGELPDKAAGAD